jgi:hypothetical protein
MAILIFWSLMYGNAQKSRSDHLANCDAGQGHKTTIDVSHKTRQSPLIMKSAGRDVHEFFPAEIELISARSRAISAAHVPLRNLGRHLLANESESNRPVSDRPTGTHQTRRCAQERGQPLLCE